MSKDERDFLDALRRRSIEAAAEILQGAQRLKAMYEEITDDGSGLSLPPPRLGDHLFQLAKFELEHASNLIRLSNSQAEMVFEHLRQFARRTQKSSSPVLELLPEDDGCCRGRFEIRNPFDKLADIRFGLAPLRTATGAEAQAQLKVAGKNGANSVRAYDSLYIDVSADKPLETLFGDLKVFLLGDIEKQVAHRVVKVRVNRDSK